MKTIASILLMTAVVLSSGCTSIDIGEYLMPASTYAPPEVLVMNGCLGMPFGDDELYVYRHQDNGDRTWYIPASAKGGNPMDNPVYIQQTSRTFEVIICDHNINPEESYPEQITNPKASCVSIPISKIAANPGGYWEETLTPFDCYDYPDEPVPDDPIEPVPEPNPIIEPTPQRTVFDIIMDFIRGIIDRLGIGRTG